MSTSNESNVQIIGTSIERYCTKKDNKHNKTTFRKIK